VKLDGAIEVLKRTVTETPYGNPVIKEATQIAIEGLERVKEVKAMANNANVISPYLLQEIQNPLPSEEEQSKQ